MCKTCGSKQQSSFRGELCFHFVGAEALNRTPVLAYPELSVCLNCGIVAQFSLTDAELDELRESRQAA
jgi:hypothetical protein